MKKKKEEPTNYCSPIMGAICFLLFISLLIWGLSALQYKEETKQNQTEESETYHFTFIRLSNNSCQTGTLRSALNKEHITFVCEDKNLTIKCPYNPSTNRIVCEIP